MDVYRAIANFTAPQFNSQGKPIHTCLSFKKGDLFEVLESENERSKAKVWWACRTTCEERNIGYVPCKYLKFHEKRAGKFKESSPPPPTNRFKEDFRSRDPREIHGRALADLRQHAGEAPPSDLKVKDPVLSPTSPSAPSPATPTMHSPVRPQRRSPASTPNKLSPGAIRVPFMVPSMLPGSPMADSPPASPSLRGGGGCNQCGHRAPSQRSDVIDLSTAFPAWNGTGNGEKKAASSASPSHCSHRHSTTPGVFQSKGHNRSSAQNSPPLPRGESPRKAATLPTVFPPGSPESRRNREGLIEPKKLINPCLESRERQGLHRELLQISQTHGEMVAMLPKKSELRQVFDKRLEKQRERDKEESKERSKPDFEKELEKHVEKLGKQLNIEEDDGDAEESTSHKQSDHESPVRMQSNSNQPEFFKIRAKLTEKAKS